MVKSRKTAIAVIALAISSALAFSEQNAALGLEAAVESVYVSAAPSVVNVTSSIVGQDIMGRAVPEEGTGSGFVYDAKGHIVTNYHVVADAQSVIVSFEDGKSYKATIVGKDPSNDLAVLKVEAPTMPPPLPIADSKSLKVGQFVVALGNPFGLDRTLTFGVISALGRMIQSPDGRYIGEVIQTDAPINPGNSGGPLLDLQGRVIGINSQIMSESGSSAGIGFAIPAKVVQKVAPQLIAKGFFPHPWLGLSGVDLGPDLAGALRDLGIKLGTDKGLLVVDLASSGPASSAGVRAGDKTVVVGGKSLVAGGDVIVAIDGKTIASFQDLTIYMDSQTAVGDTVSMRLMRGDKPVTLQVKLTERPVQQ